MTIADICSKHVITIDQNASLQEAALLMRSHHVGALVVTADEATDPHVVGIVTDRDLAIEVIAQGLDVGSVRVGQLASRQIAAVAANGSIGDAVMAMQRAGVRRLLVIEGEEQLAGVISSDDVFEALAGQLATLSGALRAGIARESEQRPAPPPVQRRPIFRPHGTAGWQA
ncbi:CBS domain-containing protein [Ideonella sp. DXS29W]|uniref:CBS domain-containing protein n=1 Tax=Ideonella lacteola TaxID=2984193 RepID=A0ABU9C0V9_9BURK